MRPTRIISREDRRRAFFIAFFAAVAWLSFLWLSGSLVPRIHERFTFFGLFSFFTALIFGGVIYFLIRRFFQIPVKELDQEINRVIESDFLSRLEERKDDGLDRIRQAFNRVFREMTELKAKEADWEQIQEVEKREHELRVGLADKSALVEKTSRELADRLRELYLLNEISQTVNSGLSLEEILKSITDVVGKTLGYKEFVVLLMDEGGEGLTVKATFGVPRSARLEEMGFKLGEGVSGAVAKTGKRILIRDTSKDERYLHYKGQKPEDGSFLSIPGKSRGKVQGVFNFFRPQIDGFNVPEMRLLTTVANQAAAAIEKARLFEKVQRLSVLDDLTQLWNRRHFLEVLEKEWKRAERFNHELALLIIDIDHFKHYNDQNGHLAGDEVLKRLAQIFKDNVREIDTVGRLGGEEFLAVLPRTSKAGAEVAAEKIRKEVEAYDFPLGEHQPEGKLTVSIGFSCYPEDGENAARLIHTADIALYRAKNQGRNRVEGARREDKTEEGLGQHRLTV